MKVMFQEVKRWVEQIMGALAVDIVATGGFRAFIGPFSAPGPATVTAATQTDLDLRYEHVSAFGAGGNHFVATRAGSIIGISGQLDTAITGAGTTITCKVTVNGTELVGGPQLLFTQAGAEVKRQATAAKDAFAFAAGDHIGVSYTSTGISNTPKLIVSVEIES